MKHSNIESGWLYKHPFPLTPFKSFQGTLQHQTYVTLLPSSMYLEVVIEISKLNNDVAGHNGQGEINLERERERERILVLYCTSDVMMP